MSTTATLFRKGLSSLLNSAIINILTKSTGTERVVELLKENLTFTAAQIAKSFQDSYSYALIAISAGLVSPEQQRSFWQKLISSNVESEFSQRIEQDYLQPFARLQDLSITELSRFRQTTFEQCKFLARQTLFQADNVSFTEAELANIINETGTVTITDLVLELMEAQPSLDEHLVAFFKYKELLGNAILFFLYEQLRKEPRFEKTLSALQREGLLLDVREIKSIVQTTEAKLNEAIATKQYLDVAQLGQYLNNLQQIETVTQTHYAHFIEFNQRFSGWTELVNVHIEEMLSTMGQLHGKIDDVHSDVKQILEKVSENSMYKYSDPKEITVCAAGFGDVETIAEALKEAKDGDKISILPGVYKESFVVDKDVEIIGEKEDGEVIIESDKEFCIAFNAPNPKISNLTLRQIKQNDKTVCTITVSSGEPLISQCQIFSDSLIGFLFEEQAFPFVENCKIEVKNGFGIIVSSNASMRLEGCRISHCHTGIYIKSNGQISINNDNHVFMSEIGFRIEENSNPNIKNNKIYNVAVGISLREDACAIIEANDISCHSSSGIEIHKKANPIITKNSFREKKLAIIIDEQGGGRITHNTFRDYENSPFYISPDTTCKILENTIDGNLVHEYP
ncbi:MAG: right-handed parallel beta-helix repeat-containing protein [Candidatus Parabeggiatoa sp.]|nr:right-handed parallel beta-helix repeat-containing protein [Candidatus Parabeggiatoa sp.]